MLRSKLTIAGSNFIFGHISDNYNEYLNKKKKLRVIFRGINIDYFSQKNISVLKQEKLKMEWGLEQNKFTILMPGRLTSWKGQEKLIFIEVQTGTYFGEDDIVRIEDDYNRAK